MDRLSRTQCQKCRYDKCLAVGMVPNLLQGCVPPPSTTSTKYVVRESNITPISKTTVVKKRYPKQMMIQHNPVNDLLGPIIRAYRETFTRVGPSRVTNVKDAFS